jgi:hypothetical protein
MKKSVNDAKAYCICEAVAPRLDVSSWLVVEELKRSLRGRVAFEKSAARRLTMIHRVGFGVAGMILLLGISSTGWSASSSNSVAVTNAETKPIKHIGNNATSSAGNTAGRKSTAQAKNRDPLAGDSSPAPQQSNVGGNFEQSGQFEGQFPPASPSQ